MYVTSKIRRAHHCKFKVSNYGNVGSFKLLYFAIFSNDVNFLGKLRKYFELFFDHLAFVVSICGMEFKPEDACCSRE